MVQRNCLRVGQFWALLANLEALTVNAVPIVSSLPLATYTKKDVIETRIGAHVQMREKQTELIRAVRRRSVSML